MSATQRIAVRKSVERLRATLPVTPGTSHGVIAKVER